MKTLKILFNFYINSSIHVSIAVVSLALITCLHFGIIPDFNLLAFLFFGTITGYNFVKYAAVAKLHHRSLAQGLRIIQIFSFLSFIMLCYTAAYLKIQVLVLAAFLGIFNLLYALPVFSKRRNLRSIPGIKVFIIATVWTGSTVVLPVIAASERLNSEVGIEFVQRFFIVLVLMLPFEIRDLKYDFKQLGTIPQQVGVLKTKIFGFVLLFLLLLLELWESGISSAAFQSLTVVVLLLGLMVWKAKEGQSRYYSSFWVEGIPIFWLLVLLLFSRT